MFVDVQVSCADREEAARIADLLVTGRLAACVHLSPIESRYEWRGEQVADDEVLLRALTRSERFDDLVRVVTDAHSYEVPAIVATELAGASAPYLRWLGEQIDPA